MVRHMHAGLLVTAAIVIFAVAFGSAVAAESFQKLSGGKIQARFVGMEMTDEVHWSDVFERGGTLTTYSMSRKSTGKWHVQKDELCIERGKDDGGCYQVWMAGKKVELRREGSKLPLEGVLTKPKDRH